MFLHTTYVAALVGFTVAIRHIEFRFHELKDLWRGILVSTSSVGTLLSRFYTKFCNLFFYLIYVCRIIFLIMEKDCLVYSPSLVTLRIWLVVILGSTSNLSNT